MNPLRDIVTATDLSAPSRHAAQRAALLAQASGGALTLMHTVGGSALVWCAALGLWRLPDFFLRMHAPALASTLAAWIVSLASIVHFSARGASLALHVWLIIIVLSITAPITTIVLARAALFRRRQAGDPLPAPLRRRD